MKTIPVKLLSLLLLFSLCSAARTWAQNTADLSIDSGDSILKSFGNTSPLAVGDALQFGYYTGATISNPFAGTWVALTGDGGIDNGSGSPGANFTVIGRAADSGAGAGQFAFSSLTFTTGSATTGLNLPSAGQLMAVRFYNGATVIGSTYYGAASDASWQWVSPASPASTMVFKLSDPGIDWLGNNIAFTGTATTIAVIPEPNVALLALLGLLFLGLVWKSGAASQAPSWQKRTPVVPDSDKLPPCS
jgi:hypothetical protein